MRHRRSAVAERRRGGVLAAMNACLAHRGPDDHGLWLARDAGSSSGPATVGLAQRRLPIVDLPPLGQLLWA